MAGFIEGVAREQTALFPDRLEDWIGEDSLVRVVDLFVDELDLPGLGFVRSAPARTGRPGYHPAVLLKLFIYGYLNRIPSSRRLEREAGRNVEVMWLTGKLVPDHKTIADFRRDNGPDADRDVYICPTGDELTYRYTREEDGLWVARYWTNECQHCPVKSRCTTGKERRITRLGNTSIWWTRCATACAATPIQ